MKEVEQILRPGDLFQVSSREEEVGECLRGGGDGGGGGGGGGS